MCCWYAGSSLEVKIETDSNDAVEIKTEADSNDITEHPCDDGPSIGMFGLLHIYIPWIHSLMIHLIIVKGLAFYHCPFFVFYNTYNLPPCLADHCHIMTSEVPICLMTSFVCFCMCQYTAICILIRYSILHHCHSLVIHRTCTIVHGSA